MRLFQKRLDALDGFAILIFLGAIVFRVAQNGKGTLAMSLSDNDRILTLTRLKAGGA